MKVKILTAGPYLKENLKAQKCAVGDILETRTEYGLAIIKSGFAERHRDRPKTPTAITTGPVPVVMDFPEDDEPLTPEEEKLYTVSSDRERPRGPLHSPRELSDTEREELAAKEPEVVVNATRAAHVLADREDVDLLALTVALGGKRLTRNDVSRFLRDIAKVTPK